MIDLKSRTHVPKTTVSRVCYHCDTADMANMPARLMRAALGG